MCNTEREGRGRAACRIHSVHHLAAVSVILFPAVEKCFPNEKTSKYKLQAKTSYKGVPSINRPLNAF